MKPALLREARCALVARKRSNIGKPTFQNSSLVSQLSLKHQLYRLLCSTWHGFCFHSPNQRTVSGLVLLVRELSLMDHLGAAHQVIACAVVKRIGLSSNVSFWDVQRSWLKQSAFGLPHLYICMFLVIQFEL